MPEMQLRLSPRLLFGSYEMNRIGSETAGWGNKAILITEKNLKNKATEVLNYLADAGVEGILYTVDDAGNSTLTISDAMTLCRNAYVDMVIGMGGIRAMALAKAVAALAPSRGHVDDFFDGDIILKRSLPYAEIPTSGRNPYMFLDLCPIVKSRSRRTRICEVPLGTTKMVIMDPTLLLDLSKNNLYLSIIESFFQAVEAFLYGTSNFLSDSQALAAIGRYTSSLSELMENPETLYIREKVCEAGIFSAFAQALVGMTPGTILSYATADFFQIPRSSVSSVLFPYCLESPIYPATEKTETLSNILKEAGLEGPLPEQVRTLIGFFDLPSRLSDLGVDLGDLSPAADAASEASFKALPGVSKDEFFSILKESF